MSSSRFAEYSAVSCSRCCVEDVQEDRHRLVEVVVAAIDVRLEELHADELVVLRVLDVVDVDVERREHLLLALRDRLRLGGFLSLSAFVLGLGLLLDARVDVERVLPAEHGGVRRLLHQLRRRPCRS